MSEQKQEARCATTQNNNDPNTQKQQQTANCSKKKDSATRRLGFRRKRIPQNRELLIPCYKIFY